MSTLIPMCSAEATSAQLRDALQLMPDLCGDPDPYTPALLRGAMEDGSLTAVVSLLADVSMSASWVNLAALRATLTPGALRAAGWSLAERRAVDPLRDRLSAALPHTYRAAMILDDAARGGHDAPQRPRGHAACRGLVSEMSCHGLVHGRTTA